MYSVPTPAPLYDIHQRDFVHPNYMGQFNGQFNTGSGELLYPQQSFDEIIAPAFQDPHDIFYHQPPDGGLPAASTFQPNGFAFDGGLALAPQYNQMQPLLRDTPGSSSQSSSFEATLLTPSPDPTLGNIPQLYPKQENIIPQPTPARRRRTRGPNMRPPGTGFSSMMAELSPNVRVILDQYDPECCGPKPPVEEGEGEKKDDSARQKHMLANKHIERFGKDIQHLLPSFICPAFVAFHKQCKTAKAGRWDSAGRHCKNCPGFKEIRSKHTVHPLQITKGEYDVVEAYRNPKKPNPSAEAVGLVLSSISRLLVMMMDAGMPLEPKDDFPDAMNVTPAEPLERPLSFFEVESATQYGQDGVFYF